MSAICNPLASLVLGILLASQVSAAEDSPTRKAYFGAVGELNGFFQQIHHFYVSCGQRLRDVDSFEAAERNWKETNTLYYQLYESANARIRASMSPQQRDLMDSVERESAQATTQALRNLDDKKAREECSSFLKNMDNPQWIDEWITPRVNAVIVAGRALNAEEAASK